MTRAKKVIVRNKNKVGEWDTLSRDRDFLKPAQLGTQPITVGDLIEKLNKYPADATVTLSSHECDNGWYDFYSDVEISWTRDETDAEHDLRVKQTALAQKAEQEQARRREAKRIVTEKETLKKLLAKHGMPED